MEKRIKKLLLSLMEQDKVLNHSELYEIICKFKDESSFNEEDIKKYYDEQILIHNQKEKEIVEYNNCHHYTNEFSKKGIYSINDLFRFINNNFEYGGVLVKEDKRIKLPFGPVNGAASKNILATYDDDYVFSTIMDCYVQISNDEQTVNNIKKQYNEGIEISLLEEYQKIIYRVGNYVQMNLWQHRNVSEILNDQISNCYETSYLVGEFLKLNKIKYQKYIIGRYDNISLAHMFITYELNNKYYYFEHALTDFKGIFQYDSKKEMEQDIFAKFIYYDNSKLNREVNFDNYFLKPIDDLDMTKGFESYFKYFSTLDSIVTPVRTYQTLLELTDLVFSEILDIGAVYNINSKQFYSVIELPKKEDFCDIELWYKKTYKILRRKIINIIFYKKGQPNNIYYLNANNKFIKLNNMIDLGNNQYRPQLVYNKQSIDNIFNIEDLNFCILNNDLNHAKSILTFSMFIENKEDLYEYGCYFTTNLSKTCISMINNNVENNKMLNASNVSLSGKICDKKYSLSNDNFLEQIGNIGNILSIMCKSIELVIGKNYKKDFINSFVDYFVYMIDINSIDKNKLKIEKCNDNEFVDEFIAKLLSKIFSKEDFSI